MKDGNSDKWAGGSEKPSAEAKDRYSAARGELQDGRIFGDDRVGLCVAQDPIPSHEHRCHRRRVVEAQISEDVAHGRRRRSKVRASGASSRGQIGGCQVGPCVANGPICCGANSGVWPRSASSRGEVEQARGMAVPAAQLPADQDARHAWRQIPPSTGS